jgi:hypothetical protein
MDDDYAEIVSEVRRKLAEHGESADDYTDEELRTAVRVALLTLAIEYSGGGADRRAGS